MNLNNEIIGIGKMLSVKENSQTRAFPSFSTHTTSGKNNSSYHHVNFNNSSNKTFYFQMDDISSSNVQNSKK